MTQTLAQASRTSVRLVEVVVTSILNFGNTAPLPGELLRVVYCLCAVLSAILTDFEGIRVYV
jgi:hypothetical protein